MPCDRIPDNRQNNSVVEEPYNIHTVIARDGDDANFVPRVTPDFIPTDALPGSREKVEVLAARVRNGQPLWHPLDRMFGAPESSIPAENPLVAQSVQRPANVDAQTPALMQALNESLSKGEPVYQSSIRTTGTSEQLQVLAERIHRGAPLWEPEDSVSYSRASRSTHRSRN